MLIATVNIGVCLVGLVQKIMEKLKNKKKENEKQEEAKRDAKSIIKSKTTHHKIENSSMALFFDSQIIGEEFFKEEKSDSESLENENPLKKAQSKYNRQKSKREESRPNQNRVFRREEINTKNRGPFYQKSQPEPQFQNSKSESNQHKSQGIRKGNKRRFGKNLPRRSRKRPGRHKNNKRIKAQQQIDSSIPIQAQRQRNSQNNRK